MKYLLDTHIALWALYDSKRLPKDIQDILLNNQNQIYYSTANIWEVEIKHLKMPNLFKLSSKQFSFLLDQNHAINLPIKNNHVEELHNIIPVDETLKHNDPFDKILLAQAIAENMKLITADHKFKNYQQNNLIII